MTGRTLHVRPGEIREAGPGRLEIPARIRMPDGQTARLWYRVPADRRDALTRQADPFAIAMVLFAMASGARLVVDGPVSPSLLANLEAYQEIWAFWKPGRYTRVPMEAERETEAAPAAAPSFLAAFSGGLDACYTVHRHVRGLAGRRTVDLAMAVMVEGFDIPLDDPAFPLAAESARRILHSVGLPMICVSTNWRMLGQQHGLNWEDSYGTAVVSALSLFSAGYRGALVASNDSGYRATPSGATPLTDPLLGSCQFDVRHDGAAATRTEKAAALAAWPEALRDLRVCWEGEDKSRNCGHCEKCVRTILNFRAAGFPPPPCFPGDISEEQILAIPVRNAVQREGLHSLLQHACGHGQDSASWVAAVQRRLAACDAPPAADGCLARLCDRARRRAGHALRRLTGRSARE